MVRELLTVPMANVQMMLNRRNAQEIKPSPFAYIAAKDGKPENLAASASRLFLGIRLECAQCHNHPFAKWKRDEFWGLAAFFSGVQRRATALDSFRELTAPPNTRSKFPARSGS